MEGTHVKMKLRYDRAREGRVGNIKREREKTERRRCDVDENCEEKRMIGNMEVAREEEEV